MKRIALAMTALVLGSLAFADSPPAAKLSGYLDAGLYIFNGKHVSSYADDYNTPGSGYVGVATVSLDAGTFGYVLGVELAQSATGLDTAYAWVSPATGLKIYGGSGSDALNDLDDNDQKLFKNADGIAAVYTINGLTLGANINPGYKSASGTSILGVGPLANFGAGYSVDKMFQLNVTAATTNDGKKINAYVASVAISAVPNLTLTAGYNAASVADSAATFFDVSASYAINDTWSVGVLSYDYLAHNSSGAYGKNGLTSNLGDALFYVPSVTYAATKTLSFTGSFYGDTADNPDYNGRLAAAFTPLAGSTISAYVEYDTNPDHAKSATAQTTVNLQVLSSF
jgi:hypothetical protein